MPHPISMSTILVPLALLLAALSGAGCNPTPFCCAAPCGGFIGGPEPTAHPVTQEDVLGTYEYRAMAKTCFHAPFHFSVIRVTLRRDMTFLQTIPGMPDAVQGTWALEGASIRLHGLRCQFGGLTDVTWMVSDAVWGKEFVVWGGESGDPDCWESMFRSGEEKH